MNLLLKTQCEDMDIQSNLVVKNFLTYYFVSLQEGPFLVMSDGHDSESGSAAPLAAKVTAKAKGDPLSFALYGAGKKWERMAWDWIGWESLSLTFYNVCKNCFYILQLNLHRCTAPPN